MTLSDAFYEDKAKPGTIATISYVINFKENASAHRRFPRAGRRDPKAVRPDVMTK